MAKSSESPLEAVRDILLVSERENVARLQARVDELEKTIHRLEDLFAETSARSAAVGEVLVDAIEGPGSDNVLLGTALQPSLEHAVHSSARIDSSVLADALYPVMGPALRKMIAELFTFGDTKTGSTFGIQQVLLIERNTGLLLASSSNTDESDADIVSGMLDAIRLFVQDAFNATEHDGLRDLRVGDTSVLVEWGPQAVLASVARGVPTESYRTQAAQVLEEIHFSYGAPLNDFDGNIAPFEPVVPLLDGMGARHRAAAMAGSSPKTKVLVGLALLVLVIVLLVILL